MRRIANVGIIGSGNAGTRFAHALHRAGIAIQCIVGREDDGEELAALVGSQYSRDLNDLKGVDLVLCCVGDDQINEVASNVDRSLAIAHCSGSVSIRALRELGFEDCGVLYPVQTLSKNKNIDFGDLPICVEASHDDFRLSLMALAQRLSNRVEEVNSERRRQLHLAAVLVNNFTNHMYTLAAELIDDNSLALLLPLIKETTDKLKTLTPAEAQTGPARRNDEKTIDAHIKMLEDRPELQEIYTLITRSIQSKS